MKRFLTLLPCAFLLLGCAQEPVLTREALPSSSAVSSESISSSVEPTAMDVSSFASAYSSKMASYRSLKRVSSGKTLSKVLFIDSEQSIDVLAVKNGEYSYLNNESHGVVNTSHTAYFRGENALVKDNSATSYTAMAMGDYLAKYGVDPFNDVFEGFSVREETVKAFSVEAVGDGTYKAKLELNPDNAANNVKIQMKQFGGLDEYPTFKTIGITFHFGADLAPIDTVLHSEYTAKLFVASECTQDYTVTFSELDGDPEIPNLESIKSEYQF